MIDQIWNTNDAARTHAHPVWGTLDGVDDELRPLPQMVAGHVVEAASRRWQLTLRDGLRFHDGTPVRTLDCVTSPRRWAARDGFRQALFGATEEPAAPATAPGSSTSTDWGTVNQRIPARRRRRPDLPLHLSSGCDQTSPAAYTALRANGPRAGIGCRISRR